MNEVVESRIGHVYAVVSPCGELVKIGRSKTPEQRMKTIITYSGKLGDRFFSPKLKNCVFVESAIHKIFEKERVYGEWFRINLSDAVRCIEEYLTSDILADENYILKAKDVSIKRNLNICKVMGIGVNKDDLDIKELSQEEQEEMVLLSLKILNSMCKNAIGNISEIQIIYDELGKGKIETVWF